MPPESPTAVNPDHMSLWIVRLWEQPAHVPFNNTTEESFMKFIGFYTKLAAANKKSRKLSKAEPLGNFRKFTNEDLSVQWSGFKNLNGEAWLRHAIIRNEVFTPVTANGWFRTLMNKEIPYHLEPVVKHYMVYAKLPSKTPISSIPMGVEALKFPVRAWQVKVKLLYSADNPRMLEESYGIYLDPKDARQKALEVCNDSVGKGWWLKNIRGFEEGNAQFLWVATKEDEGHSGYRQLLGTTEVTIISDPEGLAKLLTATDPNPAEESQDSVGSNKSHRFPLAAWQVHLNKEGVPWEDATVGLREGVSRDAAQRVGQNELKGTYTSQIAAIDRAFELRKECEQLGWIIRDDNSQVKFLIIGVKDGVMKLGVVGGGFGQGVFAWTGHNLKPYGAKYCCIRKISIEDETDMEKLAC